MSVKATSESNDNSKKQPQLAKGKKGIIYNLPMQQHKRQQAITSSILLLLGHVARFFFFFYLNDLLLTKPKTASIFTLAS